MSGFGWAGAAAGAQGAVRQQRADAADLEAQLADREYKRQLILVQQAQDERLRQQMGLDQQRFGLEQQRVGIAQQAAQSEAEQATAQRKALEEAATLAGQKNPLVGALVRAGKATARDVLDDPDAEIQREIEKARQVGDINRANQLAEIQARGAQDRQTIGARGAEDRRTIAARPTAQGGTDTATGLPSSYESERNARNRQSIAALKQKIGPFTTGFGSLLSNIPTTDARNFAAELNTLKANIAFGELAAMRAASKTGGALGAVSERELMLLESALGALDPGQSGRNLAEQLDKIDQSIARWQQAQGQAAPAQGGGAPRRGRYNPATGAVEY
jgi:hypothetical protein